ncbi:MULTISPECIES: DUF2007 domain-containing protein [Epilithonimonas]|jgi:hypothetical protein|uniref:Putative signal transducing protein n=1 Tax=Epilithonimonas zeae TaxID=1416779 RepID=A0A1N6EA46_9FLAO|nr:DUF2007 domain-containing protein [Epilithonimonas zeae]UQB70341.1 DUF2007 domain-containing protein [Epilithonimonas zeae]SIN79863.1 Putative signal transducing protein [Epilithonimonas zeae]
MDATTRVAVYESNSPQEIQLIKFRLEDAGIKCDVENSYLSFLSTPTATNTFIKVDIKDEKKAFDIIDEYLKSNQN